MVISEGPGEPAGCIPPPRVRCLPPLEPEIATGNLLAHMMQHQQHSNSIIFGSSSTSCSCGPRSMTMIPFRSRRCASCTISPLQSASLPNDHSHASPLPLLILSCHLLSSSPLCSLAPALPPKPHLPHASLLRMKSTLSVTSAATHCSTASAFLTQPASTTLPATPPYLWSAAPHTLWSATPIYTDDVSLLLFWRR